MATGTEVSVALRLLGRLDPQSDSKQLGLSPSDTHVEGDFVGNGRSGRRYEDSGWFLSSNGQVDADAFEPHIEWLLERLEPSASPLRELLTALDVEGCVDCLWSSVGVSAESMTDVEEPENAARAWGLINEDVFRRFPTVRGSGCGAHGLAVMLPRPDPALEERIRDRYGEDTTFDYGTAFAVDQPR